MTTVGLTYNVPIGSSRTSLYGSLFASADGKLCTSYNRGLISKAKIKAIKYSIVIILGKQHPSSCCKTVDIPITNLYLGPGDTKKKSVYENFCLFPIRKEYVCGAYQCHCSSLTGQYLVSYIYLYEYCCPTQPGDA